MSTYLHSGKFWNRFDPKITDFSPEDIAVHLSRIYRYAGGTSRPLTVAEHCVSVSLHVPESLRVAALLHDAEELAPGGDIPAPEKERLEWSPFVTLQSRYSRLIEARFDLSPGVLHCAEIKDADLKVRAWEASHLTEWGRVQFGPPVGNVPPCMSPDAAALVWLFTFRHYTKGG